MQISVHKLQYKQFLWCDDMGIRDLVLETRKSDKQFEPDRKITTCITAGVQHANDPRVDNRPGYIWVREYGGDESYFQVFNGAVQNRVGVPVLVSHAPKAPYRRVVLGVDWDAFAETLTLISSSSPGSPYLANHGDTHSWPSGAPGADAVDVFTRNIVPFRVRPSTESGLKVDIASGFYYLDGARKYYAGEVGRDLSAYQPNVGLRVRLLFYMDPLTGVVLAESSDEVSVFLTPDYPTEPTNMYPLAYVLISGSDVEVNELGIYDLRMIFNMSLSPVHAIGRIEAEFDLALTRHVVEG